MVRTDAPRSQHWTLYQEVGETYFVERERQAVEKQLVRRLVRLGYQVELQPVTQAGKVRALHLTFSEE